MPEIDIAIPAHNCAAWLDNLIQSILEQEVDTWRIVVRDDASTDDTAARLTSWKLRLGDRMMILPPGPNLGMVGNYDAVLTATTAPWVMFADPDDIWKPHKMTVQIAAMQAAEAPRQDIPTVVCSNAEVVDEQLRPIAPSYWHWVRMNPALYTSVFHHLVVENPVLTSTMMVNRALLNASLPMSGAASCPDWWPALVASAFGRIICRPEVTVCYRRHSQNDSTVPITLNIRSILTRITSLHTITERVVKQYSVQASGFLRRYGHLLPAADKRTLEAAGSLYSIGPLARRWRVLRHGLWFGSPIKNVGLMLFM